MLRPSSSAQRSRLAGWLGQFLGFVWMIAGLSPACARDEQTCAAGACPIGYQCVDSTGLCELQTSGPALQTSLFGGIAAVGRGNIAPVVVGFAKDRQSLAVIDGNEVSFLAGPAASQNQQPAGQTSAAVRSENGDLHVAWIRDADRTLWYGRGRAGSWQVQQVEAAAAGTVVRPLSIAWWEGQPAVAWRAGDAAAVRVAKRGLNGEWKAQTLPSPPPPRKGAVPSSDIGRSLALAAPAAGLTVAAYDATHGDVLLSIDTGEGWSTARLAGTDPLSGADTGDVGLPVAMAVGPDGELVVAYRDASRSAVMLARAAKGVVSHELVASGAVPGPAGTEQRDWIGASLSVAVRSDGSAAVAWFNGSRWSAELALQRAAGGFARVSPPAQLLGKSRQLWPAVSGDSAIWLSWVAVDATRGPTGSRVVQWPLPPEVWK
jgi:hypothetical protein